MIRSALFVGLGGIGQRHLRNLRLVAGNDCVVTAWRTRGEPQVLDDALRVVPGASLEGLYGVRNVPTLEAALAERPEVVFVTNPSALHVPVAQAAADAGSHLFVEKPLGTRLDGVAELIATVERRGLTAHVAYQLREHPGFRRLAEWIDTGALGPVYSVRAEVGEYLPGFHPYEDYRRMYAARSDLGGGVTLSQIHEIDYLVRLFGEPRRVACFGGTLSPLDLDVDDVATSLWECGDAARPLPITLHQDFLARPRRRGCVVTAEGGTVEWNLAGGWLRRWDAQGTLVHDEDHAAYPRNQLFVDELRSFLRAVRGEIAPEVSLAEGARSLRVALALIRARETGSLVALGAPRPSQPVGAAA